MKLKLACADFSFPLVPHDRVLDLIDMLAAPGLSPGELARSLTISLAHFAVSTT